MYFNKLQAPNPHSKTLIEKETSAHVFSCDFAKILRIQFYKAAPRDCFCNFNIAKKRFQIYFRTFHQPYLVLKEFTKLNKFCIVSFRMYVCVYVCMYVFAFQF